MIHVSFLATHEALKRSRKAVERGFQCCYVDRSGVVADALKKGLVSEFEKRSAHSVQPDPAMGNLDYRATILEITNGSGKRECRKVQCMKEEDAVSFCERLDRMDGMKRERGKSVDRGRTQNL